MSILWFAVSFALQPFSRYEDRIYPQSYGICSAYLLEHRHDHLYSSRQLFYYELRCCVERESSDLLLANPSPVFAALRFL